MVSEECVGLDYKKEYEQLKEKSAYEIAMIKEEHEKRLRNQEIELTGIINTQQKEIDWLKSVIKGILHIN